MAWVESHQEVGRHPKTLKAAKRLGISVPQMVGHLHLMWHWALDYADTGDLDGFDADDLALGAMWEGDSDEFVAVLRDVGFLDGWVLHDWMDYAGRLVRERERKRTERAAKSATQPPPADPPTPPGPPPVPGPSADSTRTSVGQSGDSPRAGTQPNPTQPDQTKVNTVVEPASPPSTSLTLVADPIERAAPDPIVVVFDAWREATGRGNRASLTADRRKRIKSWLREYPPEDLADACRGITLSEFHGGANDRRTRYDDVQHALKSSAHIEQFRDLWRNGPEPTARPQPRSADTIRRLAEGGDT